MKKEMKWGFYEKLRPSQIETILDSSPICILPWGALEYHGVHNPVGLDSIKAHNLAVDLIKKIGGLIFPTVNIAANLIKSYPGVDFPKHSIEFSEKLISLLAQEYLEQIANQGFKLIILLSGHAGQPHLDILKKKASEFNDTHQNQYVFALAEFDLLSDDILVSNHSAEGETSLQLHYAPETVDLDILPKDRPISLEQDAVSGKSPKEANAEKGRGIAEEFVKQTISYIQTNLNRFI